MGPYFLTLALLLFAFTTLLGNLFYCEGCLRYITRERIGKRGLTVFRLAAAALVFAGAQMEFDLVWDVADVLMGVMALINLPVIVLLGRTALSALKELHQPAAGGEGPGVPGRLHRSEGEDGLLELRQRGERARGALMGAARSFSFRPSAAHRTCRNRPCCVQCQ